MPKFPPGANPVSPLPKNQDDDANLKRAIDKRPKRIPLARVVAQRKPPSRLNAGRSTGR